MSQAPVLWIGRAQERAVRWIEAAGHSGWCARPLPLIGTKALPISHHDSALLSGLNCHDCLFLTSTEAVRLFFRFCQEEGIAPRCQIAVVGPSTDAALQAGKECCSGLEPQIKAPENTGASLAAAFLATAPEPGAKRIFFGAQDPSPELGKVMAEAGLPLSLVPAYHVVGLHGSPPPEGEWVLLFSPSGVASLRKRISQASRHPIVAVGPTTAAAAHHVGFPVTGVLTHPQPSSLTDFLKE